MSSKWIWIVCSVIILTTAIWYYPKWQMSRTEATISWDVSGYYHYLPALIIYKDISKLAWQDSIQQKYYPASSQYQSFEHKSGNKIMKYSCGMALQYLPAFLIAHTYAKISGAMADGYSPPYQFLIHFWSLLVAIAGLYFLRLILKYYYDDLITSIVLVLVTLGTNYLNYAAIDSAMTHNYLFTIYTLLIFCSIRFWISPSPRYAIYIGLCIGMACLIRPTEIISGIIPIFWGMKNLQSRYSYLKSKWKNILTAILIIGIIGSLQIIYWKIVSGEFLVYSYQEQGFSWLDPHIKNGLISYKKGWLVYTPLMIFSLLGFKPLYDHHKEIFWSCLLFTILFIYITFSWDIWWYGGSMGQRAMVQSYAVLAFPLASFIQYVKSKSKWLTLLGIAIGGLFIYYNLWLTHQAHKGGLLDAENMTRAYFWRILGKYHIDKEDRFLLDTDELFRGRQSNLHQLAHQDFELDTTQCDGIPISGTKSFCLNPSNPFSPSLMISHSELPEDANWVSGTVTIQTKHKEWDVWKMPQLIIRCKQSDHVVKEKIIRVFRVMEGAEKRDLTVYLKLPREPFQKISFFLWNAHSNQELILDEMKLESFTGE